MAAVLVLSVSVPLVSVIAEVNFAKTPLAEIRGKVAMIEASGWEADDRGGTLIVAFQKSLLEREEGAAMAELREIMGDYWVAPGEVAPRPSK